MENKSWGGWVVPLVVCMIFINERKIFLFLHLLSERPERNDELISFVARGKKGDRRFHRKVETSRPLP